MDFNFKPYFRPWLRFSLSAVDFDYRKWSRGWQFAPYRIRCADGHGIASARFLHERLPGLSTAVTALSGQSSPRSDHPIHRDLTRCTAFWWASHFDDRFADGTSA